MNRNRSDRAFGALSPLTMGSVVAATASMAVAAVVGWWNRGRQPGRATALPLPYVINGTMGRLRGEGQRVMSECLAGDATSMVSTGRKALVGDAPSPTSWHAPRLPDPMTGTLAASFRSNKE